MLAGGHHGLGATAQVLLVQVGVGCGACCWPVFVVCWVSLEIPPGRWVLEKADTSFNTGNAEGFRVSPKSHPTKAGDFAWLRPRQAEDSQCGWLKGALDLFAEDKLPLSDMPPWEVLSEVADGTPLLVPTHHALWFPVQPTAISPRNSGQHCRDAGRRSLHLAR